MGMPKPMAEMQPGAGGIMGRAGQGWEEVSWAGWIRGRGMARMGPEGA